MTPYINGLCIALPKTIGLHIMLNQYGILFESLLVYKENYYRITQKEDVMEVKERTTKKHFGSDHFYLDMRFWLILLMLAAFVSFLLFLSPG